MFDPDEGSDYHYRKHLPGYELARPKQESLLKLWISLVVFTFLFQVVKAWGGYKFNAENVVDVAVIGGLTLLLVWLNKVLKWF